MTSTEVVFVIEPGQVWADVDGFEWTVERVDAEILLSRKVVTSHRDLREFVRTWTQVWMDPEGVEE